MVCPNSFFRWFLKTPPGYTLVEMMVTMAVIAVISVTAFYGFRSYNRDQQVINAERLFLSNLRAVQNEVNNGARGSSVITVYVPASGPSYQVNGTSVSLPPGIAVSNSLGSNLYLCFVNRNLASFSAINPCGPCNTGSGYYCIGTAAYSSPSTISFNFTDSSSPITRTVGLDGNGTNINRTYIIK